MKQMGLSDGLTQKVERKGGIRYESQISGLKNLE